MYNNNNNLNLPNYDINDLSKMIDLGLDRFSYADYILLTSLSAYAISDNLNDSDLDLLIIFFSMISSDLALVRTKRGIAQRKQFLQNQNNVDNTSTDITNTSEDALISDLSRNIKLKKKKYIKRKKKKVKKQL